MNKLAKHPQDVDCPQCGHRRTLHSRNGCTNCPCPVTYMDLSPKKGK